MELRGHTAELSNCIWNFECSMVATSSLDTTARVWDLRNLHCMHAITGHKDEILDICYDYSGKKLATASSDCTAKVWDMSGAFDLISVMGGHLDEVSKVVKWRCPYVNGFSSSDFDIFLFRVDLLQSDGKCVNFCVCR